MMMSADHRRVAGAAAKAIAARLAPRSGLRPSEFAHTIKRDRAAVAEIVEDQQLVARLQQDQSGMATDKASPTSDQ